VYIEAKKMLDEKNQGSKGSKRKHGTPGEWMTGALRVGNPEQTARSG
jgi:hypothetical protein